MEMGNKSGYGNGMGQEWEWSHENGCEWES